MDNVENSLVVGVAMTGCHKRFFYSEAVLKDFAYWGEGVCGATGV